jgi:hypothetical protein
MELLKKRENAEGPWEFGVDVNAARYRDGIRETPNGEVRRFAYSLVLWHKVAGPTC